MATSRAKNPFKNEDAIKHSYYCYCQYEHVYTPLDGEISNDAAQMIHGLLQQKIVADDYSCIAAQAAFNQGEYRFGIYTELADEEPTHGLAYDLYNFVVEADQEDSDFATFIAIFREPQNTSETTFENLLWQQLQLLHQLDEQHHGWADGIDSDPASKQFGFSFAQTGFFIVGMHSQSSRLARQFAYPTLVFNMHRQFEALKENSHFGRMKKTIRERELRLQGSINPMLSDFGEISEARQYSGRAVDNTWQCPFHPISNKIADEK